MPRKDKQARQEYNAERFKRIYYVDPKLSRDRTNARNNIRRELLAELKGTTCVDCKGIFHPCQLDFDHLGDKSFVIGDKKYQVGEAKLRAEIAKCEIVCSNCHRLRTFNRSENAKLEVEGDSKESLYASNQPPT